MAKQPFRVGDGSDAQRSGSRMVSPNASKVIAHAMDSDTDSLMRAAQEVTPPDHEVGGVDMTDSDQRVFTEVNPWPAAEQYRAEPQTSPAAPRTPFKLK